MRRFLFVFAALLIAASCARIDDCARENRLGATVASTKVRIIDGSYAAWESSDVISVFYKNNENTAWSYAGENLATSGDFTYYGVLSGTGPDIKALYPYDASASVSGDVISTTLRPTQYALSRSFARAAAIMAAKVDEGDDLSFSYAVSFLRFTVRGACSVSNITVEGGNSEVICGPALVDLSGDTPVLSMDPSAEGTVITTQQSTVMDIGSQRVFYICIPPGTYEKGFIYRINYADGSVQTIRDTRSITLGPGEYFDKVADVNFDMVLDVSFRLEPDDGTIASMYNPFTSALSNAMSGSKTSAFYLKSDTYSSYPFYFYVSSAAEAPRLSVNSVNGLSFGGSVYDYILLPPVPGRKLDCVQMYTITSNRDFAVTEDDSSHNELTGGEPQTCWGNNILVFNLEGAAVNTAYRLELRSANTLFIKYIRLYYSK